MNNLNKLNKPSKWYEQVKWIYLIVGVYILVYITHLLIKFHFVLWDEAVYLGIGKYIYSLGAVGLWESIRPIGLPLLFGLPWKLGLNPVISARVIEMLFSAGTILLVYLIVKKIFDEKTAVLSAFIYAITPLFFYNSLRLMSEIPSTFFVLFAVYLFIDKKYVLAGAATSLAFLFRYPQGLILACILLAIFLEFILAVPSRSAFVKNAAKYIAGFLPVTIALLIFNYFKYSSFLYPFKLASIHQGNLVHAQGSLLMNLVYYPFTLFIYNQLLIFAVVGVVLGVLISVKLLLKKYDDKKSAIIQNKVNIAFIVLTLLIYLVYYIQMINKQDRFALSFLPFAAILAGYGFYFVYGWIRIYTKSCSNGCKVLFMAALILFSAYSITLSLYKDYHKFNSFPEEAPPIVDEYYRFFQHESDTNGFNGIILTADPVHVAYSDIKMVPYYYSVGEGLDEYDTWINNPETKAVVFIPGPFICFDEACEAKKQILFDEIKNNKELVVAFNKMYEEEKIIYQK